MMGYSSKAAFQAAVQGYGEVHGVSDKKHQLNLWRFTERDSTRELRNIPQERVWSKQIIKAMK